MRKKKRPRLARIAERPSRVILKPGGTIKYGIQYQGSKTKLIERIARFFPNADNFYDLFGGGFSVSHYMISHRSKSYKRFHFNEIRPGICELIKDAIAGKYNYDVFKPPFVSREEFFARKDSDVYVKIIWSFGNNGESYLFGQDIEGPKRSMHQAVIFDEFDDYMVKTFNLTGWPNHLTATGKRLFLKRICKYRVDLEQLERLERLQQLEQLERLERLQQLEQLQQLERLQQLEQLQQLERLQQLEQLERLQQLQRLELTSLDYREVKIKQSSVIYCDIPYKGTADYGSSFDHKTFFDWADAQDNPLFISEYLVSDSRFKLLKEFSHRTTFANGGNSAVKERLYCNRSALRYFPNLK
jgi:hypothetical protein